MCYITIPKKYSKWAWSKASIITKRQNVLEKILSDLATVTIDQTKPALFEWKIDLFKKSVPKLFKRTLKGNYAIQNIDILRSIDKTLAYARNAWKEFSTFQVHYSMCTSSIWLFFKAFHLLCFPFPFQKCSSTFQAFLSLGLPKGFKCWQAFGFRGRIYWPWENLWKRIYSWENLLAVHNGWEPRPYLTDARS